MNERVANALAGDFAHGAAFVDLTPIASPDLVPPTIALALGVREAGDRPVTDRLLDALRDRHLLLILDNFERVAAAAQLWVHATSLGGVESQIERRRRQPGEPEAVPENLLRLSVGIEDVDDLWRDLDRALATV